MATFSSYRELGKSKHCFMYRFRAFIVTARALAFDPIDSDQGQHLIASYHLSVHAQIRER